jgi:asparagine synthase (glutamine-hydrolysing)
MCGIAGYIGTRELGPDTVRGCLDLMHRRGPDAAGMHHWSNAPGRQVYFLHTRLQIIDLAARSDQPFHAGSTWLTYNGELYNYVELRDELREAGETFTTESDTEVLARALDRWGWCALDRGEGMWAFAAYDERDGSVMLARDRFGEKPLYLLRDETGVYFGSEVKFLAALAGRRLPIDYDHLYRYLVNGYRALYKEPHDFFKGIEAIPPSTVVRFAADGAETRVRYWTPAVEPDEAMTYEAAVEGTRERLLRAVKLRLRADVPLAFCMSGGVDSNSLISIAKRVFDYDVHGFTIMNDDARYNEADMVAHSVRTLGVRHTAVSFSTDAFLDRLATLVAHHDAPVYTITYYVHWLLMSEIAARGYRIAISGTAADEMFTGYYDHHSLYLAAVAGTELFEPALAAWQCSVAPIVRNPHLQNPRLFIESPGFRDHLYLNAPEFASFLRADWAEAFTETEYAPSPLRNRMLNEMFHESVPVILHEDDLNAMYFSIENRSPFLDRALFEFASSIPNRHLVRNGMAKAPLRDALSGIAPEAVIRNPKKVGFNAPIFSLIDPANPATRERLLGDSLIFDHVRRDKIEGMLNEHYLENSASKFLFNFISAKLFLEQFA